MNGVVVSGEDCCCLARSEAGCVGEENLHRDCVSVMVFSSPQDSRRINK